MAIESWGDASAAAMAARSPAPPPPITRMSCWSASSPGIFDPSLHVEIPAVAVVDDNGREVLDRQPADRLRAKVVVGDHLDLLHELGKNGAGAADGAEVDAFVLLEGVLDGLGAGPLADGALQSEAEQPRRVLVHAPTCRGA